MEYLTQYAQRKITQKITPYDTSISGNAPGKTPKGKPTLKCIFLFHLVRNSGNITITEKPDRLITP